MLTDEPIDHRAFVGPPEVWDVMAGHVFQLMFARGLRGHHKVLDIGCGSLRIGRLLIAYLEKGCYFGVEPEGDLMELAIRKETSEALLDMKEVQLIIGQGKVILSIEEQFDFILAHSIFTHAGPTIVREYMNIAAQKLDQKGEFLASFGPMTESHHKENKKNGWFYPECVRYRIETMETWAQKAGLRVVKVLPQEIRKIQQSKRQAFMVIKLRQDCP